MSHIPLDGVQSDTKSTGNETDDVVLMSRERRQKTDIN